MAEDLQTKQPKITTGQALAQKRFTLNEASKVGIERVSNVRLKANLGSSLDRLTAISQFMPAENTTVF